MSPLTATCDLCGAVARLPSPLLDLRVELARWGWRILPTGRVLCARCDACGRPAEEVRAA